MATQSEIAEHLDLSRRHVATLQSEGTIGKGASLHEARVSYIRYLREVAAGRSDSADINELKRRKLAAETRGAEIDLEERQSRLLRREDVDAAVVGAFSRVRQRLLSIPTKLAPILATKAEPAHCEAELRRAVHDALAELASTSVEDLALTDDGQTV